MTIRAVPPIIHKPTIRNFMILKITFGAKIKSPPIIIKITPNIIEIRTANFNTASINLFTYNQPLSSQMSDILFETECVMGSHFTFLNKAIIEIGTYVNIKSGKVNVYIIFLKLLQ